MTHIWSGDSIAGAGFAEREIAPRLPDDVGGPTGDHRQGDRARLLDPDKVIERELGTLHVPDPREFGLVGPDAGVMLSTRDRLVRQLALYALLEAAGA